MSIYGRIFQEGLRKFKSLKSSSIHPCLQIGKARRGSFLKYFLGKRQWRIIIRQIQQITFCMRNPFVAIRNKAYGLIPIAS